MKRETISRGVGNISSRYIQEAADPIPERRRTGRFKGVYVKRRIAAMITLCVLVCGAIVLFPSKDSAITVYACGTDEEITAAGVNIDTGMISDTGELRGKPLMFYLTGRDIAKVRFSCRNQQISFTDWTGKRDEYGNSRNFTVAYGEDEREYYYLTIDWVPDDTIRELTDNADIGIAELPEELREDIIVMEITFGNGRTVTKAVTVSLQDDGSFFARFDDYEIGDGDTFVNRPDNGAMLGDTSCADADAMVYEKPAVSGGGSASWTAEQIEAAKQAALVYYEGTVFSVNSIEYFEGKLPYGNMEDSCDFIVNVSKDGIVQEPDRTITLRLEQGVWKIVNEGY